MTVLHPLGKLREWAANYGYILVEKERIKRLEYAHIAEEFLPPHQTQELIDRMAYDALARELVNQLKGHNKLLVRHYKLQYPDQHAIRFGYQIDVIVPKNAVDEL